MIQRILTLARFSSNLTPSRLGQSASQSTVRSFVVRQNPPVSDEQEPLCRSLRVIADDGRCRLPMGWCAAPVNGLLTRAGWVAGVLSCLRASRCGPRRLAGNPQWHPCWTDSLGTRNGRTGRSLFAGTAIQLVNVGAPVAIDGRCDVGCRIRSGWLRGASSG